MRNWDRRCEELERGATTRRSAVLKKGYISSKQSICGGCKMSRADRTCANTSRASIQSLGPDQGNAARTHRPVLTLSCLKKHSILSSLKTLLQETRFWKTLGIFFRATLRPSRGSVTDLRERERERDGQGVTGSLDRRSALPARARAASVTDQSPCSRTGRGTSIHSSHKSSGSMLTKAFHMMVNIQALD